MSVLLFHFKYLTIQIKIIKIIRLLNCDKYYFRTLNVANIYSNVNI